jgi:hypothetical protein
VPVDKLMWEPETKNGIQGNDLLFKWETVLPIMYKLKWLNDGY